MTANSLMCDPNKLAASMPYDPNEMAPAFPAETVKQHLADLEKTFQTYFKQKPPRVADVANCVATNRINSSANINSYGNVAVVASRNVEEPISLRSTPQA